MCTRRSLCLVVLLFALPGALAAAVPRPVSPGSVAGSVVSSTCPTFSWSAVENSEGYELIVYEVSRDGDESHPILEQRFAEAVFGWTPSLDRCFERNTRYAWVVRALSHSGPSSWSAPILFEVTPGPSEADFEMALETVRTYLGARGVRAAENVHDDSVGTGNRGLNTPASDEIAGALAAPAGTELSVDGNVDAASFSGAGSLLTNLDPSNLSAGTAAIDISGTAATATTVAAGAIGSTEVNTSQVQLRVDEVCSPGSSIRSIFETGRVRCEVDNDSGGDITGITTSTASGLDGGCPSGTCALSVDPSDFMEPVQNSYAGVVDVTASVFSGQTVTSQSITVPTSGTVLALASSTVLCPNCNSTASSIEVYFTLTTASSGLPTSGDYSAVSLGSTVDHLMDESVLIHDVFPVGAGTTTIYLRAGLGSADTAKFLFPSISLVFIPD